MLRIWLSNADALLRLDMSVADLTPEAILTFSMTFELNFCLDKPAIEPMNVSHSG